MRSAFFVVAASIFGDIAHAATPADRITGTHYPAYGITNDAGAFKINVNIVVKTAATDEDAGLADFSIKVTFPDGSEVGQDCADEEYLFESESMLFAPYNDGCTKDFIDAMNANFRSVLGAANDIVNAPIALGYNAESNTLTFKAIGGVAVAIPAIAPVPKRRLL
jgi:hypothetical protein